MIKSLALGAKNLNSRMKNMEIVANNLANINTTGFKRELPFAEYLQRMQNQDASQLTDFTEGSFIETDNTFDLAISGDAMFVVKTDDEIQLTRNGRFKIDEEGFLVTENGARVMGKQGDINIAEAIVGKNQSVNINTKGEIKIGENVVDQLAMGKIDDQSQVKRSVGQNFIVKNDDYLEAMEDEYEVHQGFLEEANVNAIQEMQYMIEFSKNFEMSQKLITSLDQIMGMAKEIGRVQ